MIVRCRDPPLRLRHQPLQQCNLPGQAGTCATNAVAPATSRGGFVVMLAALMLTGFVALRAIPRLTPLGR